MPSAPTIVESVRVPTASSIVITARVARAVAIVRSKAGSPFAPHVLSALMTFMALAIAVITISCESRARTHDCQSRSEGQCRQFEFLQHNCLPPTLCLLDGSAESWVASVKLVILRVLQIPARGLPLSNSGSQQLPSQEVQREVGGELRAPRAGGWEHAAPHLGPSGSREADENQTGLFAIRASITRHQIG